MIRRIHILLTIATVALVVTSCRNRSDLASGEWNSKNSTFYVEDEYFNYILPTDISYWVIADKENLPPNMLFFGVDSSEGIGIGIFKPDLSRSQSKKVLELTNVELDVILTQLSIPDQGQTIVYENIDKSRCGLEGKDAWRFMIEHKIIDRTASNDTLPVYYSGYIFDALNNAYGIVLISNINQNDSIGRKQLKKYLSGLSFK